MEYTDTDFTARHYIDEDKMSDQTQNQKLKKTRTIDDEIAATQERLNKLINQKREKERKDLERNQKAVQSLLRTEKLDAVSVERWTSVLPALRKLLGADQPTAVPTSTGSKTPDRQSGVSGAQRQAA